jgi:hypothetical protein
MFPGLATFPLFDPADYFGETETIVLDVRRHFEQILAILRVVDGFLRVFSREAPHRVPGVPQRKHDEVCNVSSIR